MSYDPNKKVRKHARYTITKKGVVRSKNAYLPVDLVPKLQEKFAKEGIIFTKNPYKYKTKK